LGASAVKEGSKSGFGREPHCRKKKQGRVGRAGPSREGPARWPPPSVCRAHVAERGDGRVRELRVLVHATDCLHWGGRRGGTLNAPGGGHPRGGPPSLPPQPRPVWWKGDEHPTRLPRRASAGRLSRRPPSAPVRGGPRRSDRRRQRHVQPGAVGHQGATRGSAVGGRHARKKRVAAGAAGGSLRPPGPSSGR